MLPDGLSPQPAPTFKPFTIDEVVAVTKVPSNVLEHWLKIDLLMVHTGEDGKSQGLEYMQAFAVFAGYRWLEGGAGMDRANGVVQFVSSLTEEGMRVEFRKGNTFPCIVPGEPRMLVKAPDKKLGRDLNLRKLYGEFRFNLKTAFPE